MSTATDERLDRLESRIERLHDQAEARAGDAGVRMKHHLETLEQAHAAARATAERNVGEFEARLELLRRTIEIAEHNFDAELADERHAFTDAVEAELDTWDALMDRVQAKTASRTAVARQQVEKTIADFRRRRIAVAEALAGVRAAGGETWRDAKKRVLVALGELKRKSDNALWD